LHSTGGLIVRDWVHTEFVARDKKPPINNLIMLAPANFGSPLAHKGRAIYGRVIKGFHSGKRFQTGARILKALEMASPYTWDLAERDRFVANPYSATGIRTTVIVGNRGYRGISALANEKGSDGTVYVATANLNCMQVQLRFPAGPGKPTVSALKPARGETAFRIIDDFNHGMVALKDIDDDQRQRVLGLILEALAISNADEFRAWVAECETKTQQVMAANADDEYKHGYQNTVFRVRDDHGFDVTDYVIEFYHDVQKGILDHLAERIYRDAVTKVHVNKESSALRSFMIDCTALHRIIDEEDENLRISLSAMPDLSEGKNKVGYLSFGDDDIGRMELNATEVSAFFTGNRTLLVDIVLPRQQKPELFWIKPLSEFDPADD
ncbi:MAG: hypothetical protein WD396_08400, partial [Pseudohongiellaceae bacterium]